MPLATLMVQPSHLCAEITGRAKGCSAAERKSEFSCSVQYSFQQPGSSTCRQSHAHLLKNVLAMHSRVLGQHTEDLGYPQSLGDCILGRGDPKVQTGRGSIPSVTLRTGSIAGCVEGGQYFHVVLHLFASFVFKLPQKS